MIAPLPANESDRLDALRQFAVVDTSPEPAYDDLTRLAATVCGTPIALVSLVDPCRQWFKAKHGIDAPETSRDVAFCAHAILTNELFVVADTAADARFCDNPLVTGGPKIRFYAGMPLTTPEGHNVGTLCVIDRVPRTLTADQQDALQVLARQVVAQLVLRRQIEGLKRAEADLWVADRKLRAIFDSTHAFIGLLSPAGVVLEANQASVEAIGLTPADVIGRPYPETAWWTHDLAAQERLRDAIRRAAAGEFVRFDTTLPRRDGTHGTIDFSLKPVFDEDGAVAFLVSEGRDVTEKKRAADALRESEQRFRAFMDNSPTVAYMKDDAGRFLYLNETLRKRFGVAGDEWLGKTDHDLFPAVFADEYRRHDRQVLDGNAAVVVHEKTPWPDGSIVHWQSYKFPFAAAGQRVLAGMSVDVTAERRAADALAHSEERFRRVVEDLAEGVVELDRHSRVVQRANRAFLDLLGYTAADLAGLTQYDFVAHDRADIDEKMALIESRGRASIGFRKYRRKDGAVVDVTVSGSVLTLDGQAVLCLVVQDMTEAKRAEEAVRASEAKYRRTVEGLAEGVYVVEAGTGKFLEANTAVLAMLGYTLAEFLALAPFDIVAVETPAQFARNVAATNARLAADGRCEVGRRHFRRKDGSVVAVAMSVSVVAPGRYAVVVRDVTEEEKAQAVLLASEQRFRAFMDSGPAVAYTKDEAGRYTYVNEPLVRRFGRPASTWLGRTDADLFPAEYASVWRANDRRVLAGGGVEQFNESIPLAGGGVSRWTTYKFPFRDAAGRLQLAAIGLDVTEKAKVADALRDSEERFRTAFDHAPIGIALVAPDGRWLRANRSLSEIIGYTESELLAIDFQTVTHPDDLEADLGHVRDVLAGTKTGYQMEKRYFHKQGYTVHALLSVSLVRDGRGEPLYFISQIKDITQRKEAEERTKSSLREKEVLLKEIHHRVKNNLQIVSTLLDLQADHTQDRQSLEMFKETRGRVRSMALIHERLYRSQDLARVNFADYVRQLAEDLYRTYKVSDDDIALRVEVAVPPLPIDIAIPCGLLINELMSNCLKHAFTDAEGGWIGVTLRRVGSDNVLTVADSGTGFPPGFDFRNTTSFGLQLVNTLAEQLQGDIRLTSGRGSEFVVTFPAKPTAHNGTHP